MNEYLKNLEEDKIHQKQDKASVSVILFNRFEKSMSNEYHWNRDADATETDERKGFVLDLSGLQSEPMRVHSDDS